MRKISSIVIAAAMSTAFIAPTARAQQFDRQWTPVTTTEGCFFYEQQYVAEMNAKDKWTYSWSGGCAQGQPISGVGTLAGVHPMGDHNDITGRFVKGYKDGPFRFVRTNAWRPGATASQGADQVVRYNMGCGSFDKPSECRPARR